MNQTLYEVDININPLPPPPITNITPIKSKAKTYTNFLEPSSSGDKPFTDLYKRDSMYIAKKKSNCLCIRWC